MTGEELVAFAKSKLGVPYVYGMKGEVMTLAKYNQLKSMYGDLVWNSDKNKVGKVCCDCSGLIVGQRVSSVILRDIMTQLWRCNLFPPSARRRSGRLCGRRDTSAFISETGNILPKMAVLMAAGRIS